MPQKTFGKLVRVAALLLLGVASAMPAYAQQGSPAAPAGSAAVNGRNATAAVLGQSGSRTGTLTKIDGTSWLHTDTSGESIARFEETNRDENSVYLVNRVSGVTLQLDLRTRKAVSTDSISRRRTSVEILSATAVPVQARQQSGVQLQDGREIGSLTSNRRQGSTVLAAPRVEAPAFCMNDTVTRGTGKLPGRVADCPSGFTNNGAMCERAGESIAAPSRAADCPAGYNLNGASCERPATTKANTNSRSADCPDKYTNSGKECFRLSAPDPLPISSMTCKAGESKVDARCFKACEAGFTASGANCVRPAATAGADAMVCKAGFKKDGKTNRCIADCASGFSNTGEVCVRRAESLGAESMSCKAGEARNGGRCVATASACAKGEVLQGGLCYAACAPGYAGVGSVCVAQAPKAWAQCGAGSSKDAAACGATAFDGAALVRQQAMIVGLPGPAGSMPKRFRDLNDAFDKALAEPKFKQAKDAWEQANAGKPGQKSFDGMAGASGDEDMLRYAAQLVALADQAGGDAPAYPKCSTLFPAK
ncbi:MAG: hypothetical protein V4633_08355 [Pseudomonadota bacterium]